MINTECRGSASGFSLRAVLSDSLPSDLVHPRNNHTTHTVGRGRAALRISGGILLLLIGIDKVFARSSSGTSTTEEEREAETKQDISVFPLATPLLAGPGSMGATILLMADAEGNLTHQVIVVASLLTILLLTLVALLSASKLQKHLGITGMHVVGRIMGVLLSALAVQFILDGIGLSGLVGN